MPGDIGAIIKKVQDLPSVPAILNELAGTADWAALDMAWLASRISLDHALSAKVLRLANSSFYGLASRIASVQQALPVLGTQNVQAIVMTCAVMSTFGQTVLLERFGYRDFWRHSVATASCARQLALPGNGDRGAAFTAGMLHDIGQLALCSTFPDKYALVLEQQENDGRCRADAERQHFGFDHADVGLALTRHWNFPEAICLAIGQHRSEPGGASGALAGIVGHAQRLARHLAEASAAQDEAMDMLALLGYDEHGAGALLTQIANDIAAFDTALSA
jgi:putative nucleotidyltransferase with HDIG domain